MGEGLPNATNGAVGQNIGLYAGKLVNDKTFKIGQNIMAGDGGIISIFVDSQGKQVGSVNVDPSGNIRNVAFVDKDGISSYNDMDMDGTIDNDIISRKDNSNIGKDIDSFAKNFEGNNSYTVGQTQTAADGGKIYTYLDSKGREVGSIMKDPNGKTRNVDFKDEN